MKNQLNLIGMTVATTLLSAVLLMSCEETDYPTAIPATGPSELATARALFVNASPDAPALNFLVENRVLATAIAPFQSTTYVAIPVGFVQLRARAATGTIGGVIGSNDIVFRAGATNQTNFATAAATNYTVFVVDSLRRPAPTGIGATNLGGPQILTVTDVLTAPATGNAGVRFLHLAPDVSTVSVRLVPTAPATVTAVAAFNNRAFRVTSVTSGTVTTNFAAFTQVPAATYTAQVFSGTVVPPTSSTIAPVLSVSGVTLTTGRLFTIYARGLQRNRTLGASVIQHN